MFVLAEFELFEDEDMVLALPFELEGGTEGYDFQDAAAMAADWLRAEAEHWLMSGTEPPKLELSHASRHGGQVVIIGVSVSLEAIDTVTASAPPSSHGQASRLDSSSARAPAGHAGGRRQRKASPTAPRRRRATG